MATSKTPDPGKCPMCAKPARVGYLPFCSARCKSVDLGRWFGGHYALPTDERADAEGAPTAHNDNLSDTD